MATTETTFQPTAQWFPWQGLADLPRERSDVPRAEVRFYVPKSNITAGGTGNDQLVQISMPLPQNFAYAFADASVRIQAPTADAGINFADQGELLILDTQSLTTAGEAFAIAMDSNGLYNKLQEHKGQKIYTAQRAPTTIFLPAAGQQALATSAFSNDTDDDGVYAVVAFFRFYAYDVSQAYHWGPNSPSLIRP